MQIRDNNNLALVTVIRDPFCDKPLAAPGPVQKKNKRTQRYRSTAKSRICGMTVGDIRYCFQQLRTANPQLCPDFILYNGQCAGEFALSYLVETSSSMKKKSLHNSENNCSEKIDGTATLDLTRSQLQTTKTKHEKTTPRNLVTFQ